MSELVTGEQVAAQALTWLGTPWHRNARCKGVGADCIGVVAGVALELGLPIRYRSDYSQTPDGSLQRELAAQLTRLERLETGAVLMMTFTRLPHHVAIYTGAGAAPGLVHAYAQVRRCVFSPWDDYWRDKVRAIYRLPGVSA